MFFFKFYFTSIIIVARTFALLRLHGLNNYLGEKCQYKCQRGVTNINHIKSGGKEYKIQTNHSIQNKEKLTCKPFMSFLVCPF
jgi:hypothetical protein